MRLRIIIATIALASFTACDTISLTPNHNFSDNSVSSSVSGARNADILVASGNRGNNISLLEGAQYVTVHALDKLAKVKTCSPVYTMTLASKAPYRTVMAHIRNRAFTSGANAVAVTDWHEATSTVSMTAHLFDCSHLKGKTCNKSICKHKPS